MTKTFTDTSVKKEYVELSNEKKKGWKQVSNANTGSDTSIKVFSNFSL